MLSQYQLSEKHSWKGQKTNQASKNDRYRLNLTIGQLTKEEAMNAKRFITVMLQKTLNNYDFFVNSDLLEISVLNEHTGYYSSYRTDKY